MRGFEHAAAARSEAEAIVVRLELACGRVGWGETLPRDYVTGETLDTVPADIERELWPRYCADPAARLALQADGRVINAAGCALELAHMDATESMAGQGGRITARVSGVLGSSDPAKTAKRLRLMRWFGLRDFKLKLGMGAEIDQANLDVVTSRIGKAIAAGRCSLRVDVNGGWDADSAPDRIARLKAFGICVVEQPVYCPAEQLVELARRCELPLMADESLLTEADAQTLLSEPERIWWNVRISKNGGLSVATRLLKLAAAHRVQVSAGCMVGETSILSAAQRRLLQAAPQPRFVEGNYGRFLLADDLTRKSLRFGFGGRLTSLRGSGLGVCVEPAQVEKHGRLIATLAAPA